MCPHRRAFVFAAVLAAAVPTWAIPTSAEDTRHEHEEHKHHVGMMVGPVFSFEDGSVNPGIGVEYEYLLDSTNRLLGIGLGVETILAEHKHYVASFLFHLHPVPEITLTAGPGIAFLKHLEWERRLAFHFSVGYEFELDKIFIAPALELGVAGEDVHLMLGAHIGFGF